MDKKGKIQLLKLQIKQEAKPRLIKADNYEMKGKRSHMHNSIDSNDGFVAASIPKVPKLSKASVQ